MADQDLRQAERSGDPRLLLAARLRAGVVSPDRVSLAAALRYPPAIETGVEPAYLPEWTHERADLGLELLGDAAALRWVCDFALNELDRFSPGLQRALGAPDAEVIAEIVRGVRDDPQTPAPWGVLYDVRTIHPVGVCYRLAVMAGETPNTATVGLNLRTGIEGQHDRLDAWDRALTSLAKRLCQP